MISGTCSSAPEADFASTPVASGLWRAVVTMAVDGECRGGAEDRADVVRIGDLVEHQHHAVRRDLLDRRRGQGVGFEIEALMHRVGRQPLGDRAGPHDLRRDGERNVLLGQAAGGVLGREQQALPPRRILQRGLHRVPAVERRDIVVGLERVAPRLFESLAALALLGVVPGFASSLRGFSARGGFDLALQAVPFGLTVYRIGHWRAKIALH